MTDKSTTLNRQELASDLAAFDKLQPAIHTKARLAIVSLLAANESLSFIELRDALNLTDGNLAAHLRALGDAELIRQRKTGNPSKPTTFISLTPTGRRAFTRYLEGLAHIVNRHR
ncbi:MAG TPA: transcriptional regulator [Verrucomicrobiae bacterium]|nr:transcriptional regulator [Verrucomicrobiae bacterium]